MRHRALGALSVPVVGVGGNQFGVTCDERRTAAVVAAALDAGLVFFDTADEYGYGRSEELLGRALRGRRDEAVIATKVGCQMPDGGGASARWITRAAEASLRRLGTDYIDLYQVHYPDPAVHLDETLAALDALLRAGKVREIGCCNYPAELIRASSGRGPHPFASIQLHLNLIRQRALEHDVPAAEAAGMALLPYWPLASGLLTGKYRRGRPPPAGTRMAAYPDAAGRMLHERNLARVDALAAVASRHGYPLLELAVGWLLHRDSVACVMAGATSPEQVYRNAAAAEAAPLPAELYAEASRIGRDG
jgi:aryl-alcohol dehydrogenase-like predicted oxidoreductase